MSTFILYNADAISFLVCSLFLAASLFAMQALYREPPYYGWWSAAFAIGGLRYFIIYLVSIAGLHITVFILDLLFITQALLLLQGILILQARPQPTWLLLLIGLILAVWGYIASSLSFSWALHDIPVLGFYAGIFVLSGLTCKRSTHNPDIPTSIRMGSSGILTTLGIFYFVVLFLKPETNPHWMFITEQALLIALAIVMVFAILNKLQGEIHKATNIDLISGAYTRHYFFNRLEGELKRAQRYHRPFSMILFRIEKFAELSNSLDKKTRNTILRQHFDNICNALRDVDFTGITAAGEFAIALPETDVKEARYVAERQHYHSKKMLITGLDKSSLPGVYITVINGEANDNAENFYLRAKKIIDKKIDDGLHPLFY